MKCLLKTSCTINATDSLGHTPLHIAAIKNHISTVELLVDHCCDVNIQDTLGRTPLDLALQFDNSGTAVYLVRKGGTAPVFGIQRIFEYVCDDIIQFLITSSNDLHKARNDMLQQRCYVSIPERDAAMLLHYAIHHRKYLLVRLISKWFKNSTKYHFVGFAVQV